MPLNYSKWDNLELSDDSDIEEHPNVDKRSMIRWKQRDIHEKREARKLLIKKLHSELDLNNVLRPRIQSVIDGVKDKGVDYYRSVQRRIKEQPSDEKPDTGAPNQPTYDMMLGQLLSDLWRESAWLIDGDAKVENGVVTKGGKRLEEKDGAPAWSNEATIPDGKKEAMAKTLLERLQYHIAELDKRSEAVKKEVAKEEEEMNKKITSDTIHDGFSSSAVNKSGPSPLDKPKPKTAPKKETVEEIEVLNPGASPAADEIDEDDVPSLSTSARKFANIPMGDFEASYRFIQQDPSVLSESTHDALLLEAFSAERRGEKDLAKRCVYQSLLVNYCRELGRDGVALFFQRMIQKNPKSLKMFADDFNRTYSHVERRSKELAEEEGPAEREQIQLVAEDPNMKIGFNIPDGPPPAELRIEGEGAEELDMEQVRAFLQHKWELFESFPPAFKDALKTESLDEVNKQLGKMSVADAEDVVEKLQEGGMLSFSESGVRDMTK
ncbi:hsp90 co-chaperone Cdc37 [Trichosporon asahii var. asahii CBS 2479]|uniref:Hsp90 chaperone protein kinase-targeting subunit n=1 Tax=Trichosporon asahii var. asahii (strain ATCC 90039 / CBS 2479 / JCM 2466 / KCTC 7840 / NBRC 103889/ NCYC 2677 / UAMH 7654) TaxID=1186058 RepID=J6F286_TRIAS|nr:hsp90 co-chaperone Cdc37 [Trichosporon asahii var. asahii CBS 2479]EJT51074.1 hsp90 co-chaperone Cdc37 [Trichosporon asahii var. asahii CBS 2479]